MVAQDRDQGSLADQLLECRYDLAHSEVGSDRPVNVARIEYAADDVTDNLGLLGVDGPGEEVPGIGEHAVGR